MKINSVFQKDLLEMKIGKELSSKPQHKNVVAHESWG